MRGIVTNHSSGSKKAQTLFKTEHNAKSPVLAHRADFTKSVDLSPPKYTYRQRMSHRTYQLYRRPTFAPNGCSMDLPLA